MNYIAYSDESGTGERYTSIASFSFRQDSLPTINDSLKRILADSSVTEFKWQKLKDAKYRLCAQKIITALWEFLPTSDARIDILIWDNEDSRHAIQGRDDAANFGRMYFHLQAALMKRRPINSIWKLLPDEKVDIDWKTVRICLSAIGKKTDSRDESLFGNFFTDPFYSVAECRQVQSHIEPCIQIADLVAGLAVFSKTHYDNYSQWLESLTPTLGLWETAPLNISNREENRFQVLKDFDSSCKKRRIGVSLRSQRCLYTPNPINPINFWHYAPQHENDRAPKRKGQQGVGGYRRQSPPQPQR